MNGLQVIERRRRAEIATLDERDRQSALCRIVCDGQAVDAAADDEHVEFAIGKPRQVSNQAETIL